MMGCNVQTVLHYSLGFNSDRGGGLTKYSTDLILEQSKICKVVLLYPGEMGLINKKTKIRKEKIRYGIENFSIYNPLSIPFLCGLKDERYLTTTSEKEIWKSFFYAINPDVIHIHTLIGLSRECIEVAHEMKIPMIYTTHDYFGICSKQTLVYEGETCKNWMDCKDCADCNRTGLSKWQIYLLHTKIFCVLRRYSSVKRIKNHFKESNDTKKLCENSSELDFNLLREVYMQIFNYIDFFHFNSSVSLDVFNKVFSGGVKGAKLAITHSDVKDHRIKKNYEHTKLRLLYLGPPQKHKGFNFLIDVLDEIYHDNHEFVLSIYSDSKLERPYLEKHIGGYRYDELENIFKRNDILIVPSRWYETFGFIVVEAMSYGMPVLVTESVGAKDMIQNGVDGFVVKEYELEKRLREIIKDRKSLSLINTNICSNKFYSFQQHVKDVMEMYEFVKNK